jgi:siroheme synthase-like protein
MMLDLSGRTVVIIGGGVVGARKARGVLDAGAKVRCVSPEFSGQMPAGVERIIERYQPSHLDGATLVFAATDQAEVNSTVVRDARSRSILVCRADSDELDPGDFSTPAMHAQGDLAITVSAGSPALSALIRDRLESAIDPAWVQMARAMQELRPRIKSLGIPVDTRRKIFRELATDAAINVIRQGGPPALNKWLAARYPELAHA